MIKVIEKIIKVPTGHICIFRGEKGNLEFLSLSDYGQAKNVKADFLGLTEKINGVPHGDMLPLEEKWVVTISSQYGCGMKCKFCDVPLVGKGVNATFGDLILQVMDAISLHPEIKKTKRLNLHYARMGEPTFNDEVLNSAYYLSGYFSSIKWGFHPVVSTMCPKNKTLPVFLENWLNIKNVAMNGNAGLQLSINTTDKNERKSLFNNNCMDIEDIGKMMGDILDKTGLVGRKIALNFAITDKNVDGKFLRDHFDPEYFMCKITPMHVTKSCIDNALFTKDGYTSYYPYEKIEEDLKANGFDVIVFVPSVEEDEGRITCGNAILSGNMPKDYEIIACNK